MEKYADIKEHILAHFINHEGEEPVDPVLISWLEDDSHKKSFDFYHRIWKKSAKYNRSEVFDTELAWIRLNRINQKKQQRRNRLQFVSGLVAVSLILFVLSLIDRQPDIQLCMATEPGNRSEMTLPDGSVVHLNSDSKLTYRYNNREKIREVEFQGEGFFDVAESEQPFIVKMANNLEIKVLGTSFNLKAYTDDPEVQASLVKGSIEMSSREKKLFMKAGDMVRFDKTANRFETVKGVLNHSYGWLENKLYMEDMPLPEICKYLERNYNVSIFLQPGLEKKSYNGVIGEENIIDVMKALSRLSDVSYTINGRKISITSKTNQPMK
ncbi:MAG: DUF4974 domain-containing protein [Tannerellaceae bacterium]|jgi:ferric-dicitrate binding protein FerR (iron transport regulator)|nr:DUF4974 domain-containing protein [Tannerellaceae bacterium]